MIFKSPVAFLFSLAIAMSASSAMPVVFNSLFERDVWAPKVTNPNATTVWTIGSKETVIWYVERTLHPTPPCTYGVGASPFFLICLYDRDTSNRPENVTNPIGTLLLGYINPDGSGGENLDVGQLI